MVALVPPWCRSSGWGGRKGRFSRKKAYVSRCERFVLAPVPLACPTLVDVAIEDELDDDTDDELQAQLALLPPGFVRRALRVRSRMAWAPEQVRDLAEGIIKRRCSVRAARASLRWSVGRATRTRAAHRAEPRRVWWELQLRNGSWRCSDGSVRPF